MKKTFYILFFLSLSGCVLTSQNGILLGGKQQETIRSHHSFNDFVGTKTGRACSTSFLGFVSGDSSIYTAKKNGNIVKVATATLELESWFFSNKICTVVTGE
jgi:hypothetical protein